MPRRSVPFLLPDSGKYRGHGGAVSSMARCGRFAGAGWLGLLALLTGLAACTQGGGGSDQLGEIERLNTEEGGLAKFTFPYYTSILAQPGGGAIATWMRQSGSFRPLVYRVAPDGQSPFGDER